MNVQLLVDAYSLYNELQSRTLLGINFERVYCTVKCYYILYLFCADVRSLRTVF